MTHVVLVQEPVQGGEDTNHRTHISWSSSNPLQGRAFRGKAGRWQRSLTQLHLLSPSTDQPMIIVLPMELTPIPNALIFIHRERERKAWLSPHLSSFCIHKTRSWLMNYNDRYCALLYIKWCMPWAMFLRLLVCKIPSVVINLLVQTVLNLIIYCSSNLCLTLYGVYFT